MLSDSQGLRWRGIAGEKVVGTVAYPRPSERGNASSLARRAAAPNTRCIGKKAPHDRLGSFTSFPPSWRVRFAPRADIRPMPAFMSTRHRGHIDMRVVSDTGATPTIRTRQQHIGHPDGLHCCSTSLSEHCPSHARASIACGLSQVQHGSRMRSMGINASFE